MSYLDNEKFEDKPAILTFNGGKAGVVRNCTVKVEKKGSGDRENAPEYKVLAWDENQVKNVDGVAEEKIYPVNKGYFYRDTFASDRAEQFAVNELKHVLKTFDHELDGIKLKLSREIKDYNDFLDYTMEFLFGAIKGGNNTFDLVVDYGNTGYEKSFLQLNGYPWYIGKCGAKLENSRNAIIERPTPDDKGEGSAPAATDTSAPWV